MAEYIDRDLAIKEWYKNSKLSKSARKIFKEIPTADVIEREKIDKAIAEINNLDLNRVAMEYEDRFYGFQQEVIEIIKKIIGE